MKRKFSMTVVLSTVFMFLGIIMTGFVVPSKSKLSPVKGIGGDGKMIAGDACEDVVYGYYTISGGSSNPNTHHPWNECSNSYGIQGADPRTVQVFPTFSGTSGYTFTKLSSNPSTISLNSSGSSSCYFTLNSWGNVITIQVSKGGVSHVVSFYFTP